MPTVFICAPAALMAEVDLQLLKSSFDFTDRRYRSLDAMSIVGSSLRTNEARLGLETLSDKSTDGVSSAPPNPMPAIVPDTAALKPRIARVVFSASDFAEPDIDPLAVTSPSRAIIRSLKATVRAAREGLAIVTLKSVEIAGSLEKFRPRADNAAATPATFVVLNSRTVSSPASRDKSTFRSWIAIPS